MLIKALYDYYDILAERGQVLPRRIFRRSNTLLCCTYARRKISENN